MAITLNGTTGITTPDLTSEAGLTVDGVSFASGAPANTLVTTSGGNVGMGTSSPVARIHGEVAAATNSNVELLRLTDSVYCDFKVLLDRQTTVGSSISRVNTAAGIMAFETANTERARIDSSGNLLVGTTSTAASNDAFMVYVPGTGSGAYDGTLTLSHSTSNNTNSGYVNFYVNTTVAGSINQNGTSAVSYNTSSDYRLKNTITPMTGALAKVALLKPCNYKWNIDGSDGEGFIAHELAEVCPHAVTGEKDAVDEKGNPRYQGIDTSFLVATLTAAIQEQQALITAQQTALQEALGKIETLEARVAALEAA